MLVCLRPALKHRNPKLETFEPLGTYYQIKNLIELEPTCWYLGVEYAVYGSAWWLVLFFWGCCHLWLVPLKVKMVFKVVEQITRVQSVYSRIASSVDVLVQPIAMWLTEQQEWLHSYEEFFLKMYLYTVLSMVTICVSAFTLVALISVWKDEISRIARYFIHLSDVVQSENFFRSSEDKEARLRVVKSRSIDHFN